MKKVKYRGRWFPLISQNKTHVIIESFGIKRKILKDEVIYEEEPVLKDIQDEKNISEKEILTKPEDKLPTELVSKDFIQKEEPVVVSDVSTEEMHVTLPNKGPGIDIAPETNDEIKNKNLQTIEKSIVDFKEEIRNILEDNFSQSLQHNIMINLDSGKSLKISYELTQTPPEIEDENKVYVDIVSVEDVITGKKDSIQSLSFEEKQQVLGSIAAQEQVEIGKIDLMEMKTKMDGITI